MLKIYFGTKPLYLSGEINEEITPFAESKGTVMTNHIDDGELTKIMEQLSQPKTIAGIILHNPEEAFNSLKKHFLLIQAAGGLVYTNNNEILLIYRRGKWDLPKGKLDEGEELDTCAVREVEEETGIQNIDLKNKICITYHTYYQDSEHILKESHWYLMCTESNQEFIPQTGEDIEKCEWVKIDDIRPYLENTHPSILDVLEKGIPIITGK